MAKRRQDIATILTTHVTFWTIVANGKPGLHTRVHGTSSTLLGSATNSGARLPDQLGEVSPGIEVAEIWVGLSVEGGQVLADLTVVPHVGSSVSQHLHRSVGVSIGGTNGGNVLAVTTTTNVTIES